VAPPTAVFALNVEFVIVVVPATQSSPDVSVPGPVGLLLLIVLPVIVRLVPDWVMPDVSFPWLLSKMISVKDAVPAFSTPAPTVPMTPAGSAATLLITSPCA
jgi:hypothetical protein